MGRALKRFLFATAALLAGAALVSSIRPDPLAKWRTERDTIQAAAEDAERAGHPWAGIYLARLEYNAGDSLCFAPSGDYYGAQYDALRLERIGHGLGRSSAGNNRLNLVPAKSAGKDPFGRLIGTYRIVRWGDVRCLIRPEESARFIHCMARGEECRDFRPLCTRGYVYGEPDLPEELARARREDPMYRPITVRAVAPPQLRDYGWSWRVELNAGRNEGLDKKSRLYWDGSRDWINMLTIGERTSIGEIQQGKEGGGRMKTPLKSGMKVARWKPIVWGRPDFIYPMADMRP